MSQFKEPGLIPGEVTSHAFPQNRRHVGITPRGDLFRRITLYRNY
ncbi:hypothetical protein ALP79_200294 [Pseudomonas savastanoi pv. fraxini]|nr:hypothetical protein ALO65_200041 [Pseudomonas syringae pv. papulans]KUG40896.1 hypothetical protein ALP79_200294 [Pseudomonas savastanoi pv. fraxini]